mgnify:CR=1 FL=1
MEIDYEELRNRWENAVRAGKAEPNKDFGRLDPPNWLVRERWRGEKIESFMDAVNRVRLEDIARLRPNKPWSPATSSELTDGIIGQGQLTDIQEENKRTRGRPQKWISDAERKRAYRERRNGQ